MIIISISPLMMISNIEKLKTRVSNLINKGFYAKGSSSYYENEELKYTSELFTEFKMSTMSLIVDMYGKKHHYFEELELNCRQPRNEDFEIGIGILFSVKNDIENGWFENTRGLISAEVFSDFMEMAYHLLDESYITASAVMIGSTLEGHLRLLCEKKGIDITILKDGKLIPKKADLLNSDLKKAFVYNEADRAQITAWLAIRNKAAHGETGNYTKDQVELMYQGVLQFMSRIPI